MCTIVVVMCTIVVVMSLYMDKYVVAATSKEQHCGLVVNYSQSLLQEQLVTK